VISGYLQTTRLTTFSTCYELQKPASPRPNQHRTGSHPSKSHSPPQPPHQRLPSNDSVENHSLPVLCSPVLCWRPVGRSDLNVVAEFAELFGQRLGTIDEKSWFGFDALLDVADSLMKDFPDQAA
jgi:hypothetical protein